MTDAFCTIRYDFMTFDLFNGGNPVKSSASEATFAIGAVSRLTGIPMDTLRVWERRYHAVNPRRSGQNRRFYSREDVTRLLLIKQLVEQGEPVGTVAKLSMAELRDQSLAHAELRDREQAAVTVDPWAPRPAAPLLVYGDALPYQFEFWAPDLPELQLQGGYADFSDFARAARETRPEILLMEFPALQPEVVDQLRELLRHRKFRRAIVIYTYAASSVLGRLHGLGVQTLRAPVGVKELREACCIDAGVSGVNANQPVERAGFSIIPPRRYGGKELATIAQARTRLQCECPRHVADLLGRLGAFEDYSAGCENMVGRDAEVHARLHEAAARARAVLEDALELLLARCAVEAHGPAEQGRADLNDPAERDLAVKFDPRGTHTASG